MADPKYENLPGIVSIFLLIIELSFNPFFVNNRSFEYTLLCNYLLHVLFVTI